MKLFNAKGAIIPNHDISLWDKQVEWTLGAFCLKRHASPDKLTLGVGVLEEFSEPRAKKSKGKGLIINYLNIKITSRSV